MELPADPEAKREVLARIYANMKREIDSGEKYLDEHEIYEMRHLLPEAIAAGASVGFINELRHAFGRFGWGPEPTGFPGPEAFEFHDAVDIGVAEAAIRHRHGELLRHLFREKVVGGSVLICLALKAQETVTWDLAFVLEQCEQFRCAGLGEAKQVLAAVCRHKQAQALLRTLTSKNITERLSMYPSEALEIVAAHGNLQLVRDEIDRPQLDRAVLTKLLAAALWRNPDLDVARLIWEKLEQDREALRDAIPQGDNWGRLPPKRICVIIDFLVAAGCRRADIKRSAILEYFARDPALDERLARLE